MKKLLNKLELKPLLISILLVAFQSFLFFALRPLQGQANLIGNFIDEKIPFISLFIIPYYIWYIMIFAVPYYYYKRDKDLLAKYIISYTVCAIVATIIFTVYPSMVVRPDYLPNNNPINWMVNLVYWIDNPPINCFPSMHCAVSMLFILTISHSKHTKLSNKLLVIFMSIIIMASTLLVKQHVFIDLVSGDIIMLLIYTTFSQNKKLINYVKKLLRI